MHNSLIEPRDLFPFRLNLRAATVLAGLLAAAGSATAGMITLQAMDDVFVKNGASSINNTQLEVGSAAQESWAYLKFDLSDLASIPSASIDSVKLKMGIESIDNQGIFYYNQFSVTDADSNWDENTSFNWNAKPALKSTTPAGSYGFVLTGGDAPQIEFDITVLVKNADLSSNPHISLVINSDRVSESLVKFFSKESLYPEKVAYLEITGDCVPESRPSLTISIAGGDMEISWPEADGLFELEASPVVNGIYLPISAIPVAGKTNTFRISETNETLFLRLKDSILTE